MKKKSSKTVIMQPEMDPRVSQVQMRCKLEQLPPFKIFTILKYYSIFPED